MTTNFSQLVWLGADTAAEPAGLLNQVKHATLFEARETACKALQQKFRGKNITIKNMVLATVNTTVNFIEYNLVEYSAIQPATGLKKLFPGIKKISEAQLSSTAVTDAISSLKLNDNNNVLIVDIGDSNLALLRAIEESQQLHRFSTVYIQAAEEPLYAGATTSKEIKNFVHAKGYILQQISSNDPDLPWLTFIRNPLLDTLQNIQEQIATEQEVRNNLVKKLEEHKNIEEEKIKEIKKLRAELEQVHKHAAMNADKVALFEKANKDLFETNEQLQKRQNLLQLELIKAEAQISVIKDILLKN